MQERHSPLRLLLAILVAISISPLAATGEPGELPGVDALLEEAGFSPDQRRRVFDGEIVWQEKAPDSTDRELTIRMAFLLRKPTREVAEEDIFGFADLEVASEARQWSRIESPFTPEDFSPLAVTDAREALAEIYLNAEAGGKLNLSEDEIASFRALGSKGPVEWEAVRETLLQLLVARLEAYRKDGLSGIAPYQRKRASFDPAQDLRSAVEAGLMMKKYAPEMYRTLLEYPAYRAPGLDERFAWIHFTFEDLPCLALAHQMALEIGDGAFVVASRHFYVTRGYNVTQEQGGLFPVDQGSIFLYSNRTSLDGLAGMGTRLRHLIGRKVMSREMADIVERMRAVKRSNE